FISNTGSDVHFLRRLVSLFLGPLASAYCFVAALLVAAALRQRLRLLVPLCALIFVALLFTFSRSSLLALAAGFVVLAYVLRRWGAACAAAPAPPGSPPRGAPLPPPPPPGGRAQPGARPHPPPP